MVTQWLAAEVDGYRYMNSQLSNDWLWCPSTLSCTLEIIQISLVTDIINISDVTSKSCGWFSEVYIFWLLMTLLQTLNSNYVYVYTHTYMHTYICIYFLTIIFWSSWYFGSKVTEFCKTVYYWLCHRSILDIIKPYSIVLMLLQKTFVFWSHMVSYFTLSLPFSFTLWK